MKAKPRLIKVRKLASENVQNDTPLLNLPIVMTGTLQDVCKHLEGMNCQKRNDNSIFGIRYVDQNGDSYLLT